jgi:uncharacterized protein
MTETPNNPAPPPAPEQPAAAPAEVSVAERQFAMLIHLSALIGFFVPLGNLIAPLILWQVKKHESGFIDDQGKEAVNFNITLVIVCFALLIVTIGSFFILSVLTIPAGLALCIAFLVFAIIAGIRANDGERYRYPLIFRFVQ